MYKYHQKTHAKTLDHTKYDIIYIQILLVWNNVLASNLQGLPDLLVCPLFNV